MLFSVSSHLEKTDSDEYSLHKMMKRREFSTPMMEQYARIKKEHQDALLFFRLGDFYEMFFEDAKIASSVLDITLTSRQKVPMCGVPYHAADSYISKLLKNGFRVAICEQVEDSKEAKGVVRREVVKVLTPGTAVELGEDGEKESTYIASLYWESDDWGMALLDLGAGTMKVAQSDSQEKRSLVDEVFKFSPKEIVFPEGEEERVEKLLLLNSMSSVLKSPVEEWVFDLIQTRELLLNHFKVKTLEGFGLIQKELATRAAGALIHYLKKIRKDSLTLVSKLSYLPSREYLRLDATAIRNLELVRNLRDGSVKGSLLGILDETVTPMGSRLLRSWVIQPLQDFFTIKRRLDSIEEFLKKTIERSEIREKLKGIYDLQRLTGKISLGVAHPKDLVLLKKSLRLLPEVLSLISSFESEPIKEMVNEWDLAEDIANIIENSILDEPAFLLTEGGIIRDGYDDELDELRKISHSGKSFISSLEKKERERTGINSLKVGFNKVFGYYLEVTRPNLHLVPESYIRKQTLANAERFITLELKEYEEKVLHAEERIAELEHRLFIQVREEVSKSTPRLQKIASSLAYLDVISSLAEVAAKRNYSRPEVFEGDVIEIKEGRHPVIEEMIEEPFIPNDALLDTENNQILIVTGPNMGGKSTYLRQIALITILAQMGSFVPAKKAKIGVIDRIFTRIGAMDFLTSGQSTFMVEMIETANILNNATPKSLILLDEIGRGTSTFDGLSIAWAVAEYLSEKEDVRAKTLFATHYHELTELALTQPRIKNYHVSVKEWKDDIIFLRKISPGPSDQSYGIHVAKLAGIPQEVVERAKEVLFNLEKKELDEWGLPRISYSDSKRRDKAQLLLFEEDREREILKEIRDEIEALNIQNMTPLEALNLLNELKQKVQNSRLRK